MQQLRWELPTDGPSEEPSAAAVLREINGADAEGRALASFMELQADGSTACGCWIYCGVYAGDENRAARRTPHWEQGRVPLEWAWSWPSNRRILYNRASADPAGKPWSERKRYVWWDEEQRRWTGHDVPDFEEGKPPDYVPPEGARAEDAIRGDRPFVLQVDGSGWLFAPSGLDGRAVPDALRAARVAGRERALRAALEPGAAALPAAGEPLRARAGAGRGATRTRTWSRRIA